MDYAKTCYEVKLQIDNYIFLNHKEPNNIIVGIKVYDILKMGYDLVFHKMDEGVRTTIFGLPITVDYDNPKVLKVGYLEETSIETTD